MTYLPDLSPYDYFATDGEALTIGWLSRDHSFSTGDVPSNLLPRLHQYLDCVVNQTRGLHGCPFCDDGLAYRAEGHMGSAEIRVFAPDGTVYAAPTLVIHYIAKHRYRPPEAFIRAVLDTPAPPDPSYIARLESWGADYVNWSAVRMKYPEEF